MSRIRPGVFVALILALALAGVAAGHGAAARLSVTRTSPFTIRGTGFRPYEHVTLVVSAFGNRVTRVVVADRAGGFVRPIVAVKLGSCPAYEVKATGSRGSRSAVKAAPKNCADLQPVDG